MLLVGNGRLITQNTKCPYIENGCIAIENEKIVDYGTTEEIKKKYKGYEFIDAEGKLIMPGIINTHMHIYSAFARGMILNGNPSTSFLDILNNLWWRLDKKLSLEDVKYSAYATYMDCIKYGVTTVFDHHASPYVAKESLFQISEVAKDLGIRTCLCYEVSDRDGEEILKEGIKENIDFIKYCKNNNNNMQAGMFGMHASFTLSDKSLNMCVEAMEGMDTGYHIHTAEGIDDLHQCVRQHGKRVVERLHDFNILKDNTIAVHCIHVNSHELDLLKETNTMVIHNPESNMGNAVGCSPALEMIKRGITVGLGTDGYTSDMFESMKAANLIHKHHLCDPSVAFLEVPKMVFENNRKISEKYFSGNLGIIDKDANADIIIVDYDSLTPINENNINSHILFGVMGRSVDTTIINGKVLMKNRKLENIDEKQILSKCREVSKCLWNRI
ncbi:putative aminohydrolase SsnA [Clostridium frigidicarnis]|uniref:Putative selenium metabolism protein SsnA n=1 Tax=Clostridium frigidicarnis TaxID=84698 RepID=A0A1I0ZZE8_9CLOT|nr:putative aminohydrolase SsnA [Clostridium frigidicarnis]SFB29513.1 putative selenium metabolism protein SsnA [Clostridium frigidicarnis]